jgi:hypothetical protein
MNEYPAPAVIHRQTSHYDILGDNVYYPVNHRQVRDLLGKLLTQLDAMALSDRAHGAAKSLLTREVWGWWNGVYENATTSYKGCLAPIVMNGDTAIIDERTIVEPVAPSNRWGWQSEQTYLDSRPRN